MEAVTVGSVLAFAALQFIAGKPNYPPMGFLCVCITFDITEAKATCMAVPKAVSASPFSLGLLFVHCWCVVKKQTCLLLSVASGEL